MAACHECRHAGGVMDAFCHVGPYPVPTNFARRPNGICGPDLTMFKRKHHSAPPPDHARRTDKT